MADHVEGNLPNAGGLRLQGKLRLCAALIRVLKRDSVGARSGGGLIEKLLIGGCKPFHVLGMQPSCVPNAVVLFCSTQHQAGVQRRHVMIIHQSWC